MSKMTSENTFPSDTADLNLAQQRRRVIAASFIGNFVEWFDYAAYGYFAAIIATQFFPTEDAATGQMLTWATFAASFFIRPIAGLFWGNFGDRHGRQRALSLSIMIMSGSTFLIAFLPSYHTAGVLAPVLLLLLRVIQGFSAAGEYAGASSFLAEYAPEGKRGIYAAIVPGSTAAGLLFGSLLAALLASVTSDAFMHEWGWRLPFLMAAPMGLVGRYIRTKLEDTPVFRAAEASQVVVRAPAKELLINHWRPLIQAVCVVMLNAVGFYMILSYMPSYLQTELKISFAQSNLATTVALATYIGFIFATGAASDKYGRKRVLIASSSLFILFSIPAFYVLGTNNFALILLAQVFLGAILSLNDGTLPSYLSELFPTNVRYSGFAASFNLSNALFGGTAALVATVLIARTGNQYSPGYYLMFAAVVTLIAILCSGETSKKPLRNV